MIQRTCAISGEPHVDEQKIGEFLGVLAYPLYLLDFETIDSAIPLYDGTSPYQKIPFQFSLHVFESPGSDPTHISFLIDNAADPRPTLLRKLRESLGDVGDILVFNDVFERGRLAECADVFQEHEAWIEGNVLPRIKDLLPIFRNFDYYHPKQKGSASLKDVLPALSNLSYDGMEIYDGVQAGIEFRRITFDSDVSDEDKLRVREALLEYCKQDTFAEVVILERLRELV